MKTLALIPARSGSKGIENKNIVDILGKPLIHYTIKEAKKIPQFNRILVSTDSEKIKAISENEGISVPFLRPKKLAANYTKTIDVVIDVLQTLQSEYDETYDYVCLLQPTSPLRKSKDIQNCLGMLKETRTSVVSLVKIEDPHPNKMKKIEGGLVRSFLPLSDSSIPRQLLPDCYALNGAIYLTDVDTITLEKTFFSAKTLPYVMPGERSINIDSKLDLALVRNLISVTND